MLRNYPCAHRPTREAGSTGVGALSGIWGAMASGLMACATILAELSFGGPAQSSGDLWKRDEGLAIDNSATQGLIFAFFGHSREN